MATRTFDPAEVSVIIGGFSIGGFADSTTAIEIVKDDDLVNLTQGTDGDSIFVVTRKTSGTLTVRLLQSSASNEVLSGIANAIELGAAVPVPILVNDNTGSSIYAAAKAMPIKIPDSAFGNENNDREWSFRCADLRAFVGVSGS